MLIAAAWRGEKRRRANGFRSGAWRISVTAGREDQGGEHQNPFLGQLAVQGRMQEKRRDVVNDARLMLATRLGLRLMMHVFVRNKELRLGEWREIDVQNRQWLIRGHRMKMGKDQIVPLSRQAMATLKELKQRSGGSKYVFPGIMFKNAQQAMHVVRKCPEKGGGFFLFQGAEYHHRDGG